MNAQINNESLAKLRGSLKRGDMTEIAEQVGLSRKTVYSVLHGRSTNQRVIDAAIAILKRRKEQAQSIESQIDAVA